MQSQNVLDGLRKVFDLSELQSAFIEMDPSDYLEDANESVRDLYFKGNETEYTLADIQAFSDGVDRRSMLKRLETADPSEFGFNDPVVANDYRDAAKRLSEIGPDSPEWDVVFDWFSGCAERFYAVSPAILDCIVYCMGCPGFPESEDMADWVINVSEIYDFATANPFSDVLIDMFSAGLEASGHTVYRDIGKDYQIRKPWAFVKKPMGSIREIYYSTGEGVSRSLQDRNIPDNSSQLEFGFVADIDKSRLPVVAPLEIAAPLDIIPSDRDGGPLAMPFRIFLEALFGLEPNETKMLLSISLEDLVLQLYAGRHGKFRDRMKYVAPALEFLHYSGTVPTTNGDWRPVAIRNPVHVSDPKEKRVIMDVWLPDDLTAGYLIDKQLHREFAKGSAGLFYGYHTACHIFDKFGTYQNGRKLRYPDKPVEVRDRHGYLLDPKTKNRIRKSNGHGVKNASDPVALRLLPREPNPDGRNWYPWLTEKDMIEACLPNRYKSRWHSRDLDNAMAFWKQLEKANLVLLDSQKRPHGQEWKVYPGGKYIESFTAYRGTRTNEC